MRIVVVYDDVIREKDWEKFKFIYIYGNWRFVKINSMWNFG